jgi:hypothetical protein
VNRTSFWEDVRYEFGSLLLHIPAAMIVSPVIGIVFSLLLSGSIVRLLGIESPTMQRVLTDVPYGPLIWGSGLALGFFVNRRARNVSACWVGLIGILLLAFLVGHSYHNYESSIYYRKVTNNSFWVYTDNLLFTPDLAKCGGSECLGELVFTTPVLNSVAYSIGAWLALMSLKLKT